jgi:catechol 2,3-dioxygenase-like lactoylglutathione lyase family enzyme
VGVVLNERACAAMIPASDFGRAKKWYAETLGFQPAFEDPNGARFLCAEGTEFWVYPSQFAGTGKQTVLSFFTTEIEKDVAQLQDSGVTFESYDFPELKTDETGIASAGPGQRAAWFKDSEGNILSLFEGFPR